MRRLFSTLLVIALVGAAAAPAVAQSPTTTEELLADMVTEEVQPGVFRVVNDGVRDVSHPDEGYWGDDAVLVAGVGDIWRITPPRRLFRLGHEAEWSYDPDLVVVGQTNTEATHDGRLWTVAAPDGFRVFDGASWNSDFGFDDRFDALATQTDGTVWFMDDGALIRMPPDSQDLDFDSWEGVARGDWVPPRLAVTDAGEAWLIDLDDAGAIIAFMRFDGSSWRAVPPPDGVEPTLPVIQSWDVGPDGTLWTIGDSLQVHKSLARLDEEGWTTFTEADGVEPWGGQPTGWFPSDQVGVAPDGSVWVNATDGTTSGCDGLARFDGEAWTPYLAGRCISDLDFSPDGSVWVVVREPDATSEVDTYVITPEAERDALVAANAISGVLATVEGFSEAVNAHDTEAIRTFVTDDYTWQSTGPITALDEYLGYVDAYYEQVGFHAVSGEPVVRADGEVYIVEVPDVATFSGRELIGTTVHRVVADGDGWLLQESRWTEDASETTG